MKTLNQLIEALQKLQAAGKGGLSVYARHGASGDCSPIGTPFVTSLVDEQGPFDLEGEYVSIYVGN